MSPDYDSYARHMHAKGGAGSTLSLEQCPASSLKDREMRCYPSDVWTSPAWAVRGITLAHVHTVVLLSPRDRGTGKAIGAGLYGTHVCSI
jgi:hypothetical protein